MPLQEFEDWWRNHPKKWLQFPQAQKISAKAAWDAMEEKFTSTNSAMDAMQRLIVLVDSCESTDDFRSRAFTIINGYRAAQHQ